jgi:hypothetical protein
MSEVHTMGSRFASWVLLLAAAVSSGPWARADDDFNGLLKVAAPFTVVDKKGRVYEIAAGTYKHNVDPDGRSGDQLLKLNFKEGAAKGKQAHLKVPEEEELPEQGGEITLLGSRVGQEFDTRFSVKTEGTFGEPFETEVCCNPDCTHPDGCICPTNQTCPVTYYPCTKVFTASMSLTRASSGQLLADWGGSRREHRVLDEGSKEWCK